MSIKQSVLFYFFMAALSVANVHAFNLTNTDQNRAILESAQAIVESRAASDSSLIEKTLALRLAESKGILLNLNEKVHLTVVIAVYKEINRMKTSGEHINGEDSIREKIRQLDWFSDCRNFSWEILIIDDGCPLNSGAQAKQIVEEFSASSKKQWPVEVDFLQHHIQERESPIDSCQAISDLRTAADSSKGGSIYYGLWKAIQTPRPGAKHIVLYTDADVSAHLGYAGFAIDQIINRGYQVSIGSRKLEVDKTKGVNTKGGSLWCYLWNNMFGDLGVTDTQVGFKAFNAAMLRQILDRKMIEYGFSFDVELLALANRLEPNSIAEFPMVWIDSVPESNLKKVRDHNFWAMVKALGGLYKQYGIKSERGDSFARLALSLKREELEPILENCPTAIYTRTNAQLRHYKGVSADELSRLRLLTPAEPPTSTPEQLEASRAQCNQLMAEHLPYTAQWFLNYSSTTIQNKVDSFHRWGGPSFKPERERIHEEILNAYFARYPHAVDVKDPDAYILAGICGSGKSSHLSSLIPEHVISNEADYFKEQLAKYAPSPFPKWPLIHADYLHRESTYLADIALKRAIKGRYNIAIERTLSQLQHLETLLRTLKAAGYDVHLLSAQLYPHIAMRRVVERFLMHASGRYIPLFVILNKSHEIQKNIIKYRTLFDTHLILNTSDWKNVTSMYSAGDMGADFRF